MPRIALIYPNGEKKFTKPINWRAGLEKMSPRDVLVDIPHDAFVVFYISEDGERVGMTWGKSAEIVSDDNEVKENA